MVANTCYSWTGFKINITRYYIEFTAWLLCNPSKSWWWTKFESKSNWLWYKPMSNGAAYKQVLQPCIIRIVKTRHKSFRSARDSIRISTPCIRGRPLKFWLWLAQGWSKFWDRVCARCTRPTAVASALGALGTFLFFVATNKNHPTSTLSLYATFNILLAHGPENPEGFPGLRLVCLQWHIPKSRLYWQIQWHTSHILWIVFSI